MPVEAMAPIGKEDADVGSERQRVLKGRAKLDLVKLENLTKIYTTRKLGKHLAVHRLCLGIPKGEVCDGYWMWEILFCNNHKVKVRW